MSISPTDQHRAHALQAPNDESVPLLPAASRVPDRRSSLDAGRDDRDVSSFFLFSALRRLLWNLYSFVFFADVDPLLDRGVAENIRESSASEIYPQDCDPAVLLSQFKAIYHSLTV